VIAKKDREEKHKDQTAEMARSHNLTLRAIKAAKDSYTIDHVAVAASTQSKSALQKVHLIMAKEFGAVKDGALEALKEDPLGHLKH